MNRQAKIFQKKVSNVFAETSKFLFISVDLELQTKKTKDLLKLKDEASYIKSEAIEKQDEDSANALLSMESIIEALIDELRMWVALKKDDPNKAWDFLVNAQYATRQALQAHNLLKRFHAVSYCKRLYLLEKLLFPPQFFFSPCFIIERAECSICGSEYGKCNHVVGKAYMGKLCCRIIKEIKEIKEVSIVKAPANKHNRIMCFSNGKHMKDTMTLRNCERGK